jgi:hypothetical protein
MMNFIKSREEDMQLMDHITHWNHINTVKELQTYISFRNIRDDDNKIRSAFLLCKDKNHKKWQWIDIIRQTLTEETFESQRDAIQDALDKRVSVTEFDSIKEAMEIVNKLMEYFVKKREEKDSIRDRLDYAFFFQKHDYDRIMQNIIDLDIPF